MTGPCAKVRVFCTLVHPDGRRWYGENVVRRPQPTCPRVGMASGVGYGLCRDVCDQVGHAEVVALAAAGPDAADCTAYITGRDFICYDCQERLVAAGVRQFVLGEAPPPMSTTARDLYLAAEALEHSGHLSHSVLIMDHARAWRYEALRLRRVVTALDLARQVPEDDDTLRSCLFSVLGIVAGRLERTR